MFENEKTQAKNGMNDNENSKILKLSDNKSTIGHNLIED